MNVHFLANTTNHNYVVLENGGTIKRDKYKYVSNLTKSPDTSTVFNPNLNVFHICLATSRLGEARSVLWF